MDNLSEHGESFTDYEDYMQSHGIQTLLHDCINNLYMHRPENPVQFLYEYFETLLQEQNETVVAFNTTPSVRSIMATSSKEFSKESFVSQEYIVQASTERRGAICVGPVSEDDVNNFVKRTIPKSPSTIKLLSNSIGKNVLFTHLDESERKEIFEAMFRETHSPGDIIINQGSDNQNFYIVEQGEVEILDETGIKIVREGGTFGELALICDSPCAITAQAKTSVKLWVIDRDTYRHILVTSAKTKRKTHETLLAHIPILEMTNERERQNLADALECLTFEDGEVIVKQNEVADSLYIIVEGSAIVLQHNKQEPVCSLGPSDYFGETSLLVDRPRAATVVASAHMKCIRLEKERFERVAGPCSNILKRNMPKYNNFMSMAI